VGLLALLSACGAKVIYRMLDVEIDGLSAQAAKLTLEVFPASADESCTSITLQTVQSLRAPVSATWTRSSGADRVLMVQGVDEPGATVVVYTEDSTGRAIQLACAPVTYEMIELGTVAVTLSARATM
jgi:hypothetical protein